MPERSKLRYEVVEGVATVTLDDPDTRNSLSPQLLEELLTALRECRADDAARCLVLASSHEKVFSSGANLGAFGTDAPITDRHAGSLRFVEVFKAIGELGKPSLVAANGHVLAGSLGIAMACDLIIAKEGATFGTPEINVGLFPFMIMALIYRNVPRKKTNEMLLLGERLTAEEAREAGHVDGRRVAIAAYDFTVMAGSMGMTGELKVSRLRELTLKQRMPLVWLLDSAGARIQEAAGSLFAGSGPLFREEVEMSGVIPLVAAMLGPCAAGTAYIPGLSDFVPMVVGQGAMALAGPHLTKAVTGEDISMEDLGGARVHCRVSGVGDLEVKDDPECIDAVKRYLSHFPPNCEERPPLRPTDDPDDRMSEALLDIVPESSRQPYDMYDVIAEIVDDGEWFDIKPKFAKTIITCFARFGGQPVGIVANQPKQLGGILENDSADKAARFINLCDAFNIPLVFLQDVPGFMVGSKVEHAGIIRHGAKMLYAVSRATVPKIIRGLRMAAGKRIQRPWKKHGVMPV